MLIALCGRAGSGKSTVAKFLAEKYGAKTHSFARPLKGIVKDFFGFTDEQVYGTQAQKETVDPRWGMSPRQALQKLGTDCIRKHLGDDVWRDAVLDKIDYSDDSIHVIEDCRFQNEAAGIREKGGVVVKLICPDRRSFADEIHPSEASVDFILGDVTIVAPTSPDAIVLLTAFENAMVAKYGLWSPRRALAEVR